MAGHGFKICVEGGFNVAERPRLRSQASLTGSRVFTKSEQVGAGCRSKWVVFESLGQLPLIDSPEVSAEGWGEDCWTGEIPQFIEYCLADRQRWWHEQTSKGSPLAGAKEGTERFLEGPRQEGQDRINQLFTELGTVRQRRSSFGSLWLALHSRARHLACEALSPIRRSISQPIPGTQPPMCFPFAVSRGTGRIARHHPRSTAGFWLTVRVTAVNCDWSRTLMGSSLQ